MRSFVPETTAMLTMWCLILALISVSISHALSGLKEKHRKWQVRLLKAAGVLCILAFVFFMFAFML